MHLTPSDVFNEIQMTRNASPHPLFVVEGGCDARLVKQQLDIEKSIVIVAHGKQNLIGALARVSQAGTPRCIGLADLDFDNIVPSTRSTDNVIYTKRHDIEMELICSSAFDRLVASFASSTKVEKLVKERHATHLRDVIMQTCLPIATLRYMSILHDGHLKFEGLKFDRFIDRKTLKCDDEVLVKNVLQNSVNPQLNGSVLKESLKNNRLANTPIDEVVCGHDVLEVLSIGMRTACGNFDSKTASVDHLGKILSHGLRPSEFRQWGVGVAIDQWLDANNIASPWAV